jgi:hypothetical protein
MLTEGRLSTLRVVLLLILGSSMTISLDTTRFFVARLVLTVTSSSDSSSASLSSSTADRRLFPFAGVTVFFTGPRVDFVALTGSLSSSLGFSEGATLVAGVDFPDRVERVLRETVGVEFFELTAEARFLGGILGGGGGEKRVDVALVAIAGGQFQARIRVGGCASLAAIVWCLTAGGRKIKCQLFIID